MRSNLVATILCTIALGISVPMAPADDTVPESQFDVPGLIDLPATTGRDFNHYEVPDLGATLNNQHSRLVPMLDRYNSDRHMLMRYFRIEISPKRQAMFNEFFLGWREAIESIDFASLSYAGQIDYLLFRNHLDYQIRKLAIDAMYANEMAPLLAFAQTIIDLEEARVDLHGIDPEHAARELNLLTGEIKTMQERVKQAARGQGGEADTSLRVKPTVANRAVRAVGNLRRSLQQWFNFHNSYEPEFTWWVEKPFKAADEAMKNYSSTIQSQLVKAGGNGMMGDPIGNEALLSELAYEMIPYTPDELIDIANREFEWCNAEMLKASQELGYGDNWHGVLEYVKTLHVGPGDQATVIRDMAFEAIDFLKQRDLISVEPLCRDSWRMEMMSPERQRFTPFFTGGEVISVAFPTDTMTHEQKLMSIRANNVHFSRATVQHELVPGHHLQQFVNSRNKTYRRMFGTPFWSEGWALYWEMLLWDNEFQKSPENRIGMLFWRMHRCARIIFSLSYHLEKMTPQECVDFLVERVGHERASAEAEVRRSISGGYGPLYQCAYMLGGLQFRALHKELVQSGQMTDRQFHDAILLENSLPVELVRAIMTRQPLTSDFASAWRFYDDLK